MENYGGYVAPLEIGEVMRGTGLAEIVESRSDALPVGSLWTGMLGWTEYLASDGSGLAPVEPRLDPTASLSLLGLTGMTAWVGLTDIGKPIVGDTVLVSGAAGATDRSRASSPATPAPASSGLQGARRNAAGSSRAPDSMRRSTTRRTTSSSGSPPPCPEARTSSSTMSAARCSIACSAISRLAPAWSYAAGSAATRPEAGPPAPPTTSTSVFARARMEGFIVLDHEVRFPAIA